MIFKYLNYWSKKRINIYLYLKGWLAVRHSGWALSADNDGHVEAVAGESGSSACNTEGFWEGVPWFLAENWVYQLDDLILKIKDVRISTKLKMHGCKWNRGGKAIKKPTSYLFQWGLHVHMIWERIGSGHKKSSHLKSLFKLKVQASKIIQTGCQVLRK